MSKILLINGPNLNLLGTREPEIYGRQSLEEIQQELADRAAAKKIEIESYQSNSEGDLISRIHDCAEAKIKIVIINPGAFSHTSIALRDAFLATDVPFIEVHISNIFSREEFRRHSFLSDIAVGVVAGFGISSYRLGLDAAITYLKNKKN